MKATTATLSLLMTGLMAVAGVAQAQATTSNVPATAGEASTTMQGQPNAATAVSSESRAAVKADARAANKAGTISRGEIGTSDGHGKQAGLEATPTTGKTRAELRAERDMKKAQRVAASNANQMGTNSRPAGVPSTAPAGTPSVMDGGTPK